MLPFFIGLNVLGWKVEKMNTEESIYGDGLFIKIRIINRDKRGTLTRVICGEI